MTIRDVPQDVRDELAARAARAGRSLQEHVRAQLIEMARRPSADDVWRAIDERKAATGTRLDAAQILEYLHADRR